MPGKSSFIAICIFLTSCSQSDIQTDSQSRLIKKINDKHDLTEDLRTPGMIEASYLGRIKLSSVVANAIAKHRSALVIRNESEAFTEDESNPLKAFSTREADCITNLSLVRFPITDKMLEPIRGKPLIELQIIHGELSDLQAIKGMTSLQALNLSGNPLNSEGMKVLGSLPNLRKLVLNSTPIYDTDLHCLYNLKKLDKVRLTSCQNLSKPGIQSLSKALPSCKIAWESNKRSSGDKLLSIAKQTKEDGDIKGASATVEKLVRQLEQTHSENYALLSKCHNFLGECRLTQNDKNAASAEFTVAHELAKRRTILKFDD